MSNKKATKRSLVFGILSLLLSVTMLVGTTFAWFTDSVTSSNNIIKSGTLDVGMYWTEGNEDPTDTAVVWEDASTGAIFNNDKWEPGYTEAKHIKIVNEGTLALKYQMRILANGVVSELADAIDVYYYETAIRLTADNYKTGTRLGTLSEVLNNTAETAISKVIAGKLEEGEAATLTLAMHMQEEAGNEYQGLSIGTDFSIQILATQYSSESDSFGPNYDAGADFAPQTTPSPMVSALSGDELNINVVNLGDAKTATLDAGYQFEPTETYEQAQQSTYRYYHADFVVSADKDIPANSLALAGYYALYCNAKTGGAWVALSSDEVVTAGTEIRLIEKMSGGSISVNYEELCNFGNDGTGFQCGLIALDEEALKGATVTVELRLYETEEPSAENNNSHNVETGNYISAGVFTYNYGAVEVNDPAVLEAAMKEGGTIKLAAGNYTMPQVQNENITLVGTGNPEDTVVDITSVSGLTYMNGSTLTVENLTIQSKPEGAGYSRGFAHAEYVVYNNCIINGTLGLQSSCEFNDCTFNIEGNYYNVWTWGSGTASFDGCTFNCDGKALLVYANTLDNGTNHQTINITDCVFNDNGNDTVTGKAAIEISNTYTPVRTYDVFIKNTTVNGFAQTVPGNDDFNAAYGSVEGSDIGTNVWGNKCQLPNTQINVVIDGVDVY